MGNPYTILCPLGIPNSEAANSFILKSANLMSSINGLAVLKSGFNKNMSVKLMEQLN